MFVVLIGPSDESVSMYFSNDYDRILVTYKYLDIKATSPHPPIPRLLGVSAYTTTVRGRVQGQQEEQEFAFLSGMEGQHFWSSWSRSVYGLVGAGAFMVE